MAKLTEQEIETFLAEPRIAHLVTLRATGTPHVAPVWFLWDEGSAVVMADSGSVKLRNIRRNPAVALSIATTERPLSYVVLEGPAEVTDEGLDTMIERICVHYDGPERGAQFAKTLRDECRMFLIRISVDRMMTWQDEE